MNDQQTFIFDQFQSITNHQFQQEQAIQLLSENNWNLEISILNSFNSNPVISDNLITTSRSTAMDTTGQSSSSNPNLEAAPERSWWRSLLSNEYTQVGQSMPGSFPQDAPDSSGAPYTIYEYMDYYTSKAMVWPFEFIFKAVLLAVYKLTQFETLAKVVGYPSNRSTGYSEAKAIDPADKARNFIRDFEECSSNGTNHLKIPFYEGSYSQALFLSKKTVRFLLVYIQSDEHDDKLKFIDDIILNPRLIELINSKDILVWGGNINQSESYQVANSLQATRLPFLALLCLTTSSVERPNGTEITAPTLSVISRTQGYSNPTAILDKLTERINKHEAMLIGIRHDKQEEDLSRLIRQQQDEAYQRSMARDRERQRHRAEELERQREERFEEERLKLLKAKSDRYIKWKASILKKEPSDESNKKNYARIAIKLNTGEKIYRKFEKDMTLQDIYLFVEIYQKGLLNQSPININEKEFENFKYDFSFNLISPMPRVKIVPGEVLIKDEKAVWPNGNLMMEDI